MYTSGKRVRESVPMSKVWKRRSTKVTQLPWRPGYEAFLRTRNKERHIDRRWKTETVQREALSNMIPSRFCHSLSRTSQAISQSDSQPVNQSSPSVSRPNSQPVKYPVGQPDSRSIRGSGDQPVRRLVSHPARYRCAKHHRSGAKNFAY